jgi:hypothetical protein
MVVQPTMSAFKSILLQVDNSPRMAARFQLANELARLHHARVTCSLSQSLA